MKSKIFYGFIFICLTRAIGFVLLPLLLKSSPILLIILSPFLHHLILTSTLIPPPQFLLTGIFISIFQCSIGYEFGRRHGLIGLEWTKKNNFISYSKIDLISKWLRYSAPLILFLIPGPFVAMVAGVSNLKPKHFFTLMIPSQIFWIVACFFLGVELHIYLNLVKIFVIDHWITLTFALVIIKALQNWRKLT